MTVGTMNTFKMDDTLSDRQLAGHAALETIKLINFGMAIVGSRRRTLFINDSAKSIIEHSEVLKLKRNIIRFLPASIENWLAGHFRNYCPENNVQYILDGKRHLVFSIHLLPNSDSARQHPLFSLSLNHLPIDTERVTKSFSAMFCLTSREAEVSGLLIGGNTILEIASILGVKESTIRSHTKKIYLKTRVSRQTDLIRMGMLLRFR